MFEDIEPRSPTPLYEQIAAQIRVAVASGELRGGAILPSVRRLSQRLRVNPATVVQAYRDLERDGFVTTKHGSGTYVNEVPKQRLREEQTTRAVELVRQMLANAARMGIPTSEIAAAFSNEAGVVVDE